MSSLLRICQILHPAPEERLQTVTEIKKSRLFDGVYVTLDKPPLSLSSLTDIFKKRLEENGKPGDTSSVPTSTFVGRLNGA